jgi:hypothetical protein
MAGSRSRRGDVLGEHARTFVLRLRRTVVGVKAAHSGAHRQRVRALFPSR